MSTPPHDAELGPRSADRGVGSAAGTETRATVAGRIHPVEAHRRTFEPRSARAKPRSQLKPPRGLPLRAGGTPEWVVVEEPLQILIAGEPWVVTLRTPGHDRELAMGLLLSEGLVRSAAEVGSMAHCGRLGEPRNALDVLPAPGTALPWPPDEGAAEARRGTLMSAACGLCGRQSVDALMARLDGLPKGSPSFDERLVQSMLQRLTEHQTLFDVCGATHAAGLWDFVPAMGGARLGAETVREDVGRHNAVDKVLGRWALSGAALSCPVLAVSGRCSFEMVQKAVVARVRLLVCVSAPTSLAVRAAERAGLALVAFGRAGRFTIYSGIDSFTAA